MARTLRLRLRFPLPGRLLAIALPALALAFGTALAPTPPATATTAMTAASAATQEAPATPATPAIPAIPATPAIPLIGALPVPENIVAHNIPPIPRSDADELQLYENMRSASFADWHPKERRMLILTRFAQTLQLHEVATPLGARSQVTFFDEPVNEGSYRPNDPSQIVLSINQGGAENYQLLLLDRHTGRTQRFSDGVHRYESPLWSHSGTLLAYVSNARNGRDFDLYTADPARPGSERRVAELNGQWQPLDWSADDRRLLLGEYISAGESYLHAVDLATGKLTALTPRHPAAAGAAAKTAATVAYQGGHWGADGASVYTTSTRDGEFLRLVRIDRIEPPSPHGAAAAGPHETPLSADIPWNVESFDLSEDGVVLAFFANEEGISRLHLIDTRSGKPLPSPTLPPGAASAVSFRRGSHDLAFAVSWARSPFDVYSYDPTTQRLDRWTASETGGLDPQHFAAPQLVRYPTFDSLPAGSPRTIPAFVYHPDARRFPGRRPVYITIHGGPEGQARPSFLGSTNYLLDELGVAVIAPNVRGSTGYGKTYLDLDNGAKLEDSVKDIGALLDWIATQPDLDSSHVMVAGGSYGGYMTLAAMTHYSDRLACGFDTVGISNFVTFLEHTQAYRRDLRRVEYGDERDPRMRAFLEEIAPMHHADRIRKPLLVAAGANDPRVPVSESDQIAAAVESNHVPVWYMVAKDEGHGYQKKANVDYLRTVSIVFLKEYLLGSPPAPPAAAAPSGH
jgi:dipeptidyl aminopeptidase/acylaminoacyl peptidase